MSDGRVAEAGIVEHQPEVVYVAVLASAGVLRRRRAAGVADFSPGLVARLGKLRTLPQSGDTGAAQLVREQVGHAAAGPHGDAASAGQVIRGGRRAADLTVVSYEADRGAIHRRTHPVAVAVAHKRRRQRRAAH